MKKTVAKAEIKDNMTYYEELYKTKVRGQLKDQLKLENIHEVPMFDKVVLNMGVSEAVTDNKVLNSVQDELSKIAGQRAVITKAKKSIAGFKIREGMKLGCKVTLRRKHMWEFLERLINIALPRVRDFRGLSNRSFDKEGNYSFGLKEHIVFPEINYDTISKMRGMDITVCIKSNGKEHSLALLKAFDFPIR